MRLNWRAETWLDDWLPWLLPLDDARDAVITRSGGFLRVAQVELPDLESSSPEALDAHHDRVAQALSRLGTGWSVWIDQWRTAAPGYMPESDFGGRAAARAIDASRRRQFTDADLPPFSNSAFVALHWVPQPRDAVLAFLLEREGPLVGANVAHFRQATEGALLELRDTMRGLRLLAGDELSSYLAACVRFRTGWVSWPTALLAPQLACAEWHTGLSLRVDDRHVSTVELISFGSPTALTCEALHELPFEARWTVAVHGMDHEHRRRELREVRKGWVAKQKGLTAHATDLFARLFGGVPAETETNPEAERALSELRAIEGELVERPFGLAHANVHVWAADRATADDRAAVVAAHLNGQGLIARPATLNTTFAPLADMPGNVAAEVMNVRRLRVELAAVTRVAPVTGISEGHREDWRFGGPALIAGMTRRGVPFFWSMNAPGSDSAHTSIVGSTGGGKSALVALMAAQFLRYPDARVAVFDRGRSFMVPCLALGGDWIELGSGGRGVQPLRAVDRPEELHWAHEWVMRALKLRGLATNPAIEGAVSTALHLLATDPPHRRTLTQLHAYLAESDDARATLRHYLAGQGPYGELFDGVVDSYGDQPVIGVETSDIVQLEDAAPLAVTAMFRAIRRDRLTGDAPKLVVVDEAWSLLENKHFHGTLNAWAREMRKLKAALVLSTQSVADLQREETRVIDDQIGNRVYLPQPEALRPQTRDLYLRAGLTIEQVELLAGALPKSEYLLQQRDLARLMTVRLEDDALAICGASSPADHARARTLLAEGVTPGNDFAQRWLAQTTTQWLAGEGIPTIHAAE